VARPREAVGCRTLICRKADSGQLNDLPTLRQGESPDLRAFLVIDLQRMELDTSHGEKSEPYSG